MIQSEVAEQIKKLPNGATRLLVYILIIAVVTLFWLLINKGTGNEKGLRQEIQNLNEDKRQMQSLIYLIQSQRDSIQLLRWKDKIETVEQLKDILKGQDTVKNTLKKLK